MCFDIYNDSEKRKQINKDIQNRKFVLTGIGILIFIGIIYLLPSTIPHQPALREAVRAGIIALAIAYFGHIDTVYVAFAFVFILTFYRYAPKK